MNCGSSSLKFGVYHVGSDGTKLKLEGEAEEIGRPNSGFFFRRPGMPKQETGKQVEDYPSALQLAVEALKDYGDLEMDAVGHRVVHGGPSLREHKRIDSDVLQQLRNAVQFAPLHIPPALEVIKATEELLPDLPQVVCLDTSFHRTMPAVSRRLPLSEEIAGLGVEKFGFHGLSLESILRQLSSVPEKLIVAHLGNGCSVTAILRGKSIDTTMGLTPTGGVMMGNSLWRSRSGGNAPSPGKRVFRYGQACLRRE